MAIFGISSLFDARLFASWLYLYRKFALVLVVCHGHSLCVSGILQKCEQHQ